MARTDTRVCFVSTIAWPLRVYIGPHIRKIAESSQVTLVADGVSELANGEFDSAVRFRQVAIPRRIRLGSDVLALFKLWRILRSGRFDCVHSIMPKAGLLSMLAGAAAGVPVRFHTFTGQVWATRAGLSRRFLMLMDWLIARLATSVLTDSLSQRDFLIANGIVKAGKISVLGNGSVVGVDPLRFAPDTEAREQGRRDLGIGTGDFVFLFVGRLNRDKGVTDLLQAFAEISHRHSSAHLVLVGPDEDGYDVRIANLPEALRQRLHRVGFTSQPERCMAVSDVICLPSYREGFGSVLIEAAAGGLPAVASRIYGISDAVVDGVTGILHEPGNVAEIVLGMLKLAEDQPLRSRMGAAARARAVEEFSEERLTTAFQNFYRKHGVLN
ncbi:glycosyltransferase family 4 protein [Sulfuritalea hydrogenivorans]|jgi:glycosyltransferase involved in cell wall biosynthesis|uniref:Putative Capsular polysaccharide biosynthesis glycosyl transferase n=1 Tax=Sulfuritalea hydrogenivorans sk43H TaxID=1223802 RepID=W0SJZ0_9PROT|nr:glycosyltransferase family 4 protein [Sulfuritalea hydrogenivorans]BAO31116.1 putative Capsular polysaccharide biosynthesis glycosyl transferase [Sulfuritalea hydrogenivorans sk43H]